MDKEEIIEILEDYEFFVDDDFGGHYEHINCSQKALTPLGIVNILDYIVNLEQQVKKQKETIDNAIKYVNSHIYQETFDGYIDSYELKKLLEILKEVQKW